MRVLETQIFRGPNPYGYRPVIRLTLDLEELEEYPSDRIPGFTDRLIELIPSLQEHGCSYGEPGGFVLRLREGTWIGHIVEHIALELQCLAGTEVTYGKTRSVPDQPGVYFVIYSYREERVGREAGNLALRLVRSLLPEHLPSALQGDERASFDFGRERDDLISRAQDLILGPTTASLVDEARKRGIPAIRLDDQSLVQLGYGKYQQRIRAAVTGQTSYIAVETASDKELTIRLLGDVGLPVPRHRRVRSAEDAAAAAEALDFPLVVKPLDVSHGRGVSLNLNTVEEVVRAFEVACEYSSDVLVETFLQGNDYRVLVINGEVVAVAERVPAHVIGDGKHTIAELIELVNRDPRRGFGHEKVLTKIKLNHQSDLLLERAGYTLATVLASGERFALAATANLSTGGTAIDRTTEIHYETREIARRAALIVGLDVAGIDVITPDISQPLREVGGGIVEVNAGPGFRMHLQPSEGTPRNVARFVIDMLFPPGQPTRIPILSITGTNGKTTTARMVAHILKMHGQRVGLTTTDGIYIDGELYLKGDLTGPWSARMVLKDPTIEAAVLETARGGILREGLGFERCDVGAVLNVSNDHLGLRGIHTVEQIAEIKGLVIEVVRDDGASVLNADDPLVAAMADRAEGRLIYFSMHGGESASDLVKNHIANGGTAVVLQAGVRGDMIAIYDAEQYIPLLWTHLIPATLEGKALHNVANALAATAIAYAHGVTIENIRQGLRTFNTSFYQAPGRLNIFDEHPFRVLVDYGHNPAAFAAMRDLVERLRPSYPRIIGVVSAPGDRRTQDIAEAGGILGTMFDLLILKEDDDRRGRASGEVIGILREAALAAGMPAAQLVDVPNELEAVRYAMNLAEPGELVIIFADNITGVWKEVIYHPRGAGEGRIP
ncbi:cyanophycin synthetase [Candidatus Chloroploca asiatica]|uniref:Cyanophycin synthetase n=1 Tax=Candidatus Chloroploca asiatica TaxID=1506545 RepID=A0A2H3KPQ0_9CHLR|nr:cyanophycin synthetase [Candidatus Chloroploca asiatica]PDV97136.1 cyanophycin synthetase [Candidatus Chloroploca asiatica]